MVNLEDAIRASLSFRVRLVESVKEDSRHYERRKTECYVCLRATLCMYCLGYVVYRKARPLPEVSSGKGRAFVSESRPIVDLARY
jgi:hypothetical protein